MFIHFTDQPPAYPSNDKPPDYHDVFPCKTAMPPPVDISAVPDSTPAAHIPSANITPRPIVHFPPTDHDTPIHIPFTITYNGITTNNSSMTTATVRTTDNIVLTHSSSTAYPPENIVLTQLPTDNSNLHNATEVGWLKIMCSYVRHICVI